MRKGVSSGVKIDIGRRIWYEKEIAVHCHAALADDAVLYTGSGEDG